MKRRKMWREIQRLRVKVAQVELELWFHENHEFEYSYRVQQDFQDHLRVERSRYRQRTENLQSELDTAKEMSYAAQAELAWLRFRVGEGLYEEFVAEQQRESK